MTGKHAQFTARDQPAHMPRGGTHTHEANMVARGETGRKDDASSKSDSGREGGRSLMRL